MSRLPRDLSGEALVKAFARLGYIPTRQTGSHVRLTTEELGKHHVTVPLHDPLGVGTLGGIIRDVSLYFVTARDDIVERLFGRP